MYLVTGGRGFIGKDLIRRLLSDNEEVLLLSSTPCNDTDISPQISVTGTILDTEFLNRIFSENEITGIYHLSAISDIRRSIADPYETFNLNVIGTVNLLEAMRRHDVKRMVFASTAAVYGNSAEPVKKESGETIPLSPYAASKLMAEEYCNIYSSQYGMNIKSLRYFNPYGPGMRPDSPASVVLKFINSIISKKSPVIFGDGTQTRDFVYINDITQASIKAMNYGEFGIYNVGTGVATPLRELAAMIMEITGINVSIDYQDARIGDILHSSADISKAKRGFGYSPEYSLHKGLNEMINALYGNELHNSSK
ncbi:NAD-dependent epimerase/dehydratase family protein [Methanomicrobium mobile]|uniref:NAD-dependent epimerase/dehydratase family protein n=1 Tax=Methanomicrobium mobile TaxID=2205 RepID=UPI0006933255|nr:NAD-dependent epimerase/dehydratase family protein [Methanomicrobium mobile]